MRRVIGIIVAVVGVLAIVGSFVWRGVAVDALVKYPDDVDENPRYEGTVTLYLDQETYAPLETPVEAPLQVSRRIQAVEASSDLVVVRETLDLEAEGLFSGVQEHQYVMDRKEMVNVADDRAWAFTEDNPVDRSGSFRLQFPFDTEEQPYSVYKNEVGTTYETTLGGRGEAGGLSTIDFGADQSDPLPVTDAYLTALDELTPLPRELTLEQLDPILKEAGIDVDALLPALLPALSPEDTQALLALAGAPIGLQYVYTFTGSDSVEPSTGSIVEVRDVVETLWATPDPAATEALGGILGKYPDVPEAVAATEALQTLATSPIKVFENSFSQTADSVEEIADTVSDNKSQKNLAESTVPTSLLIGGIVLAALGLLLVFWPSKKQPDTASDAGSSDPDAPASEV